MFALSFTLSALSTLSTLSTLSHIVVGVSVENKCVVLKNILDRLHLIGF